MKESQIAGVLTPILAQFGLELEAVEIIPAGKRRLLRVVVDGHGPDGTGPLPGGKARGGKAGRAEQGGRGGAGQRRRYGQCGLHVRSDVARSERSPRATSALAQERRSAG